MKKIEKIYIISALILSLSIWGIVFILFILNNIL